MTKKIIHTVIFLIVAGIVASAFINPNKSDDASKVMQLPALIVGFLYLGIMFVVYILPAITDKATHAVLDSNEVVESDPLHDARAAYARGEYKEAIEVYKKVAEKEPDNRLPWVEIAKIQHDNLENPALALNTLQEALENNEWSVNNAAFFMSKIADIYLDDLDDREASLTILNQIVETFPETRHSANATHKIKTIEREA